MMMESEKESVLEQLKAIKPGHNYPRHVVMEEANEGKIEKFVFSLQSYFVGMYCAIHVNGASMPHQTGDHDNKKFVRCLKKDLIKAVERGAKVEVGALWPVKTDMN